MRGNRTMSVRYTCTASVSSTRMPGLNGLPVGKSFGWMTFLVAAVAETDSARLSSRTVSLRILLSLHQRRRKRDQSGRNVLSVTCSNANGHFVGNLTRGNLVRRFDRAIRGRARGWYPANRRPTLRVPQTGLRRPLQQVDEQRLEPVAHFAPIAFAHVPRTGPRTTTGRCGRFTRRNPDHRAEPLLSWPHSHDTEKPSHPPCGKGSAKI